MKITLAFLLLGTCIVFLLSKLFWLTNHRSDDGGKLTEEKQEVRNSDKEKKTFRREIKGKSFTNARSVPKKTAHEAESLSHVRMLALSYNRWREYQECNRCSSIEKSCKLRAIMSDCFIILNLMANDLGVEKKKLLSVKVNVKITVLIDALEKNDYESYANHVEKTGSINSFMEMMTIVVKGSADKAGLDLGVVLNDCLGDALRGILNIFPDILGGLIGSVTGIIGGVVNAATGIVDGLTGSIGGLTGGLGGLTGGLTGSLGGLTGGLGDLTGGLTGSLGGLTGGLGGITGSLGGLTGGLGGLTGGLGGLTGSVPGGKKGVKG